MKNGTCQSSPQTNGYYYSQIYKPEILEKALRELYEKSGFKGSFTEWLKAEKK